MKASPVFVCLWALLAAIAQLAPVHARGEPNPTSALPPNFLVIMVDDLDVASFQQLLKGGKLPNVQRFLIDEGTTFSEAFVSNSLCCPSRASFLTGQYAHNHGVQNVAGTNGGYPAFHPGGQQRETVASWLQDDQIENRVADPAYQNELTFLRELLGQLESCSGESCRGAEAW